MKAAIASFEVTRCSRTRRRGSGYGAEVLLGSLRRLQPRLYSIASSPKAHPVEVHLTVAAVRYDKRNGVASVFLADRAQGSAVSVFVQRSKHLA